MKKAKKHLKKKHEKKKPTKTEQNKHNKDFIVFVPF